MAPHGVADANDVVEIECLDEGGRVGAELAPIVGRRFRRTPVTALVHRDGVHAVSQGPNHTVPAPGMEARGVQHEDRGPAPWSPLEVGEFDAADGKAAFSHVTCGVEAPWAAGDRR